MKFSIELKALTKMLAQVSKKMPHQKHSDPEVSLFACQARVFLECNQTVVGVEALLLEDGSCRLHRAKFKRVISTYRGRKNLTIDVNADGLRIGGFTMAVKGYSATANPPAKFAVFAVIDLNVTSSQKEEEYQQPQNRVAPRNLAVTASADLERTSDGLLEFRRSRNTYLDTDSDTTEADYPVFCYLAPYIEHFIRISFMFNQVTPQMMVGLTRALYAFKRLPVPTTGIDVYLRVHERLTVPTGFRDVGYYVSISDKRFEAGDYHFGCEGPWKKESHNPAYSLCWGWSQTRPDENDWGGEEIASFGDRIYHSFERNAVADLIVTVKDTSEPGCMPMDD